MKDSLADTELCSEIILNLELRVMWCEYVVLGLPVLLNKLFNGRLLQNSGKLWGFVIADFDYLLQFFIIFFCDFSPSLSVSSHYFLSIFSLCPFLLSLVSFSMYLCFFFKRRPCTSGFVTYSSFSVSVREISEERSWNVPSCFWASMGRECC